VSTTLVHDPLLDDLNEAQRAAVTHGEGPLLVLAGAGTGKTRVLTRRIAWLIATRKAAPHEILGLTFTEKAAQEMEERVDRLVPFGYTDMTLLTFHAFGRKLLSEFGMLLGLPKEPRVLTQAEAVVFLRERLFALPLDRLRPLGDPTRHLDDLVRHFGRLADEDISPEAYAAYAEEERRASEDKARLDRAEIWTELAACYRAYLDLLAKEGVVDFAGLLTLSLRLLREQPALLSELRRRYPWVLVDEFQDTNFVQFEIVRALAGERPNLTVVGDDDQSIYKFRGASISNILDFRTVYEGSTTRVLVENYRSTQEILDAAYKLIRHNDPDRLEVREKVDKRLLGRTSGPAVRAQGFDSPSTEADFVAVSIKEAVESGRRRYGDCAVLVRRHAATDPVMRALALAGVPCRVADGGGLYDRPEVIACVDALAAMSDPTDDRALFFLRRVRDLRRACARDHRASARGGAPQSPPALRLESAAHPAITRLLEDLREMRPFALRTTTGESLYRYLQVSGYLERLSDQGARGDAEADLKVQNLAKLFARARGFNGLAVRDRPIEFVRHLAQLRQAGEDPRAAEPEDDEDAVHVLTVHRAKGLEFPGRVPGRTRGESLPRRRPARSAAVSPGAPPPGAAVGRRPSRGGTPPLLRRHDAGTGGADAHVGGRSWRRAQWKASPFVLEALDQARVDVPLARTALRGPDPSPHEGARAHGTCRSRRSAGRGARAVEPPGRRLPDLSPALQVRARVCALPTLPHPLVGYGLALHNAIRDYYVHAREGWPVDAERLVQVFEESWTGRGLHHARARTPAPRPAAARRSARGTSASARTPPRLPWSRARSAFAAART
jgi:DNA helicase-2/ATP-dependent DNA helicase PcrA